MESDRIVEHLLAIHYAWLFSRSAGDLERAETLSAHWTSGARDRLNQPQIAFAAAPSNAESDVRLGSDG
jgi:hypothetical protein